MAATGKLVVLAGLPAAGKTTLLHALNEHSDIHVVPEHNDWIGGSKNFPKKPTTITEKMAKQAFFIEIDRQRHAYAQDFLSEGKVVIFDTDFLAPLAHNFAERQLHPHLDIYPYLVSRYSAELKAKMLRLADLYIYLDVDLSTRAARRAAEATRRRNDVFFTEPFPSRMRTFYFLLLHPSSPSRVLNTAWYDYSKALDQTRIWRLISSFDTTAKHNNPYTFIKALERSQSIERIL